MARTKYSYWKVVMVCYILQLIQMQCKCSFSQCKHALGQMILWANLVPIQNCAVSLQQEQHLILRRSICSTTVMPSSINIGRPFPDWCVYAHDWFCMGFCLILEAWLHLSLTSTSVPYWSVCVLSYRKYEYSIPPATFLWFLLLIYLLCFFIMSLHLLLLWTILLTSH